MKISLLITLAVSAALTFSSCSTTNTVKSSNPPVVVNETTPVSIGARPSDPFFRTESLRKVIYRDQDAVLKALGNSANSTIVINYCVDTLGVVTYAEIDPQATTEKKIKYSKKATDCFLEL